MCKGSPRKGKYVKIFVIVTAGYIIFVLIPSFAFSSFENWTISESVYFAMITLTTIGFGDYVAGKNRPLVIILSGDSLNTIIRNTLNCSVTHHDNKQEEVWKSYMEIWKDVSLMPYRDMFNLYLFVICLELLPFKFNYCHSCYSIWEKAQRGREWWFNPHRRIGDWALSSFSR